MKEDVIGIITKKAGESYVVDIGTRDRVTLPKLAFAGATKKNKPDLKVYVAFIVLVVYLIFANQC